MQQCARVMSLLLVAMGVGCGQREHVKVTAAQRADTMTNVLFGLRVAQLTSSDPMIEEVAVGCEMDRLIALVGADSMMRLAELSRLRVQEVATREQLLAVRRGLGGRMRIAGAWCDSLAAAGKLGGPYPGPSPPGAAWY
jgi:integrase